MPTLTSVTKHFITAQEGFTTTTAGSVASGASTVTLNSVSGYTNGDQVAFVIDPTDVTKKQVFTGTIDTSGVQVTNVVWTEGTNQTHAAGATVVDYTTATHQAAMVKGVKVSLDDDGTLKAGAVDNSGVFGTGVIPTAAYGDGTVTNAKLATTTGELGGAWQSWTPTHTNTSVGNGIETAKYTQIGTTIHFYYRLVCGTTTSVGNSWAFTLPVTGASYLSDNPASYPLGNAFTRNVGIDSYGGLVVSNSSTTTVTVLWYASGPVLNSNFPYAEGTGDHVQLTGTYEAA